MEIDHIFICINDPEKITKTLIDFGLTEGETNTHVGQGTANKRFFFAGFYLELLYLADANEATSPATAPTQFYERLTNRDDTISPFGFIFRPSDNGFLLQDYKTIIYKPRLLPKSLNMTILQAPLRDPMYFYFDFLTPSSRATYTSTRHDIGFEKMTSVKIQQPNLDTQITQDIDNHNIVKFEKHDKHLLEITFDDGAQGKAHDFRPEIPLIFKW